MREFHLASPCCAARLRVRLIEDSAGGVTEVSCIECFSCGSQWWEDGSPRLVVHTDKAGIVRERAYDWDGNRVDPHLVKQLSYGTQWFRA